MVSILALNAGFLNDSLLAQMFLNQKAFKVFAQRHDKFIAIALQVIFDVVVLTKLNKKFIGVLVVFRQNNSPRFFFLHDIIRENLRQAS